MTKIEAVTKGLSQPPYFALSPTKIAKLRKAEVTPPKPDTDSNAA